MWNRKVKRPFFGKKTADGGRRSLPARAVWKEVPPGTGCVVPSDGLFCFTLS